MNRWRRALAARRAEVEARLAELDLRLVEVRAARAEWTDEEHDPEGFALTFEWQQAEGSRATYTAELAALEGAAARLRDGTFGVCATCGRPIPDAQLELRPARTRCVACDERQR